MADQSPRPLAYRYATAAAATGLSERKLSELVKDGKIPFIRVGRSVLFPAAALERWLADRTTGSAP